MLVPLRPLARRGVGAQEQHGYAGGDGYDKRDDEGETPRDAVRVAPGDEGVEDGGHDEVRDAASRVSPPSRQRVGAPHDVLIEETGRPDLARHERSAEDADEKSTNVEALGIVDERGEAEGDRSEQESAGEYPARPKPIAGRSGNQPYQ